MCYIQCILYDAQLISKGLDGKFVVEVACGHGDAHTLIRLGNGKAMSFGDTDHGKLGRSLPSK